MGLPETAGKVTPAIHSQSTNQTTSRRPHQHKVLEKSAQSRKVQKPPSASEPLKLHDKQGIHPMTRSTKNHEASSSSARRAAGGNQHTTASNAAGDSQQIHTAPFITTQGKKLSAPETQSELSKRDIEKIERQTRGQRENQDWHYWRQNRITASLAHQISHSRFANNKTEDIPQSYLKAILGSGSTVQTTAMSWGIRNEKKAVQTYERMAAKDKGCEVQVEECGLFIHPTKTWLAASPDGIVKDKHTGEKLCLLEVNCPYKHKEHTIEEACKDRNFCLALNGDSYILKLNHAYYTQVQCQLAATGMSSADFVVYTNKETAIIPVKFDPEFWEMTEPKLEKFYVEAVLPHAKKMDAHGKEPQNTDVYVPEE
ncbi:uncharacterized protein LOC134911436 [Pseudophryne corroboree]|uniref:uncharacterized protein LOC134911436 n=1 Tax=Pseudophryne corroboree TaxID=495146 RepID=UPI003081DE7A